MDNLQKLVKSYEQWVAKNPDILGEIETTVKWASYFIGGRISDSNIVSELVYSLSNMLVLYNDRIIDQARGATENEILTSRSRICYRLKVILTTLEYSEVLIEITAKRAFGKTGRWMIISMIQLFKAAGRLYILKNSMAQIITSPAIPTLNRRALIKQQKANGGVLPRIREGSHITESSAPIQLEHSITVKLKRSGRLIRKVEGAPPMHYRDFKLHDDLTKTQKLSIPRNLIQAEYLYIAKPLIHLATMGLFGQRRWKQYVTALSLDLLSIHLYYKNRHMMSKEQRLELSRRCINLLFYLMRSPFFESYTKSRLDNVLQFVAGNIPVLRMIAQPLRDYIPHWQSTYFYVWST